MLNILNDLVKAIENGRAVAMATLIDVRGASPAPMLQAFGMAGGVVVLISVVNAAL